jgi:hypothetical protein
MFSTSTCTSTSKYSRLSLEVFRILTKFSTVHRRLFFLQNDDVTELFDDVVCNDNEVLLEDIDLGEIKGGNSVIVKFHYIV